MIKNFLKWIFCGAIAGVFFGALDFIVIVAFTKEMFFDVNEMYNTAFICLGLSAGAGALFLSPIGAIGVIIKALSKPGKILSKKWRAEILVFLILLSPLFISFYKLTAGPQASVILGRFVLVGAAAFLSAAAGAAIFFLIPLLTKKFKLFKIALIIFAVFVSTFLYVVDLKILVRLYPVFHLGLSFAALFIYAGSVKVVWQQKPNTAITIIALLLSIASIAGLVLSFNIVKKTQNSRFVISEKTAMAVDVLNVAKIIVPFSGKLKLDKTNNEIENVKNAKIAFEQNALSLPDSSIILITVDAMRYDRISNFSKNSRNKNSRHIAPAIENLAKQSVVFNRAYTAVPHTSYAISSLLTGKYTKPLFDVPGAPLVHETWPQILHRFRYETGAFFTKAVFFIDRVKFAPYEKYGYGFKHVKMDYELPAAVRVEQTIDFLKTNKLKNNTDKLVFSWTHFFEPHEPYDNKCTKYGSSDEQRYNCEISKVDAAIAVLLNYVNKNYPTAIVILSADHGEEFDDHGGKYHGTTLYDEQVRVPLLIRIPNVLPKTIKQPVSLVDLLGTTLSILDIPIPARVRSRDLTRLIAGLESKQLPVFAEVHEQTMAVHNNYKLIWDTKEDIARLYDLKNDPKEKVSIAEIKPQIVIDLKRKILKWKNSHAKTELRPIQSSDGLKSWPVAIQKSIGGDQSYINELVKIVTNSKELELRKKSAQLISHMWKPRLANNLPVLADDDNIEIKAWIAIAAFYAKDKNACDLLKTLLPKMERFSNYWLETTLIEMSCGNKTVTNDIIEIVKSKNAPIEKRIRAVNLLGQAKIKHAQKALLSQINNYPMSLEIVNALGKLGNKLVIKPLITRLKRERFADRRFAVAKALCNFKDKQIIAPIALELTRTEPMPQTLQLLFEIKAITKNIKSISDKHTNLAVDFFKKTKKTKSFSTDKHIWRVAILTNSKTTKGTVNILCNNKKVANISILAGRQQSFADCENCLPSDEKTTFSFEIINTDLETKIEALAFISRK